jgi:hypothetical protein
MIGVVSHDAGGAEIISAWLKQKKIPFVVNLEGPALKIFTKKFSNLNHLNIEDIFKCNINYLLCGSSWESDLEKQCINKAKKENIKTIVYLDHWKNYQERFIFRQKLALPDEIWVGDEHAEKMVKKIFDSVYIKLVENEYFKEMKREILCIEKKMKTYALRTILYVCEPISDHSIKQYGSPNALGYTEESALEGFIEAYLKIYGSIENLVIRPHPSENKDKYNWILSHRLNNGNFTIGGDRPLMEEICEATVVAGCESMALVIALLAGKEVFSSIPKNCKESSLPFSEIINIHELIK